MGAPHIYAFTAGKGGCGKTTIATNFANILWKFGNRVLVVDCDFANQGATGAFAASVTQMAPGYATARGLLESPLDDVPLVQVKERFWFLPAEDLETRPEMPQTASVEEVSTLLRQRLTSLAEKLGVQCIILDCFCGVDELTTATIGAADHAYLINEPDLVTFTGTLLILRHLRDQFENWARSPHVQFVINRMRPPATVRKLMQLYRNNLSLESTGGIAVHFPYNERIARNFGKHPFISDLLPKSLFVAKLELLAYSALLDSDPERLPQRLRGWSERRRRKLYLQSVDPAAVDAETLVVQLTRFAALGFVTFLVAGIAFDSAEDPEVVERVMGLVLALALFCAYPLARAIWSAARLNWTLATYRVRAATYLNTATLRTSLMVGALGHLFTSLVLFGFIASGAAVAIPLGLELYQTRAELRKSDTATGDEEGVILSATRAQLSLDSPLESVDFRRRTVEGEYKVLVNRRIVGRGQKGEKKRTVLVDSATLKNVLFKKGALDETHLDGTSFSECVFASATESEGNTITQGANPGTTNRSALSFKGVHFEHVTIDRPKVAEGTDYVNIEFGEDSQFVFARLLVRGGTTVDLRQVKDISGLQIENLDRTSRDEAQYGEAVSEELVSDVQVLVAEDADRHPGTSVGVTILVTENQEANDLAQRIEQRKAILSVLGKERNLTALTERANLVELYLARNLPQDRDDARRLLAELKSSLNDKLSEDPDASAAYQMTRGLSLMLSLMLQVRDGVVTDQAATNWAQWLKQNPRSSAEATYQKHSGTAAWSWRWDSIWNKQVTAENTPPEGFQCFTLIQKSAKGEITSDQFLDGVKLTCPPKLQLRGRVRKVPRTIANNGTGEIQLYNIDLWLELPADTEEQIASVIYILPESYRVARHFRSQESPYRVSTADLWGCVQEVEVKVNFKSGESRVFSFDWCPSVGWAEREK